MGRDLIGVGIGVGVEGSAMAFGHEMPIDASLLPSAARLTAFGSDIETNGGTLPGQPVSLILLGTCLPTPKP